uniref:Uncharacterized protein n=1 Tax=Anguilla anguilla TaxID=7936 RepID=A0A0E9VEA2_ANGAN
MSLATGYSWPSPILKCCLQWCTPVSWDCLPTEIHFLGWTVK